MRIAIWLKLSLVLLTLAPQVDAAREFDRESSMRAANASTPVTDVPLTMACWFKATQVTNDMALMSLGTDGANDNRHVLYARGNTAGDPVGISSRTTTATLGVSASGYTVGAWFHAAAVVASATSRIAFIDGVPGTENTTSKVFTVSAVSVGSHNTPGDYHDGAIAMAAVWSAALTTPEIASLAKGRDPRMVRPDALAEFWPLWGNASPEPGLVSALALTLTNGPTKTEHPQAYLMEGQLTLGVPDAGGAPAGQPTHRRWDGVPFMRLPGSGGRAQLLISPEDWIATLLPQETIH